MSARWLALLALLAPLALCAGSAGAARTLVSYERSGAMTGIRTSLSVTVDGMARVTTSRATGITSFQLSSPELGALERDLRRARFPTLRSLYDASRPIADGVVQIVCHAGRRVTVTTGARPPERLRRVLDRLSRLAAPRAT